MSSTSSKACHGLGKNWGLKWISKHSFRLQKIHQVPQRSLTYSIYPKSYDDNAIVQTKSASTRLLWIQATDLCWLSSSGCILGWPSFDCRAAFSLSGGLDLSSFSGDETGALIMDMLLGMADTDEDLKNICVCCTASALNLACCAEVSWEVGITFAVLFGIT